MPLNSIPFNLLVLTSSYQMLKIKIGQYSRSFLFCSHSDYDDPMLVLFLFLDRLQTIFSLNLILFGLTKDILGE